MYDYNYLIRLERESKWEEAAKVWRSFGRHDDAKTCDFIVDAIRKGDEFRAKDKETVYSIIETIGGHFGYTTDEELPRYATRLIGRVYGIGEATYYVTALKEEKDSFERLVTGMKLDFPELN